jgi:hypothetical protein
VVETGSSMFGFISSVEYESTRNLPSQPLSTTNLCSIDFILPLEVVPKLVFESPYTYTLGVHVNWSVRACLLIHTSQRVHL